MQIINLLIATAIAGSVPTKPAPTKSAAPVPTKPVAPVPTKPATTGCKTVNTHVEWRRMTPANQKAYIDAVRCLKFNTKSKLPASAGSNSVYDDMVYLHNQAVETAHNHPAFLPWHRLMLGTYWGFLQSECHYTGPMPFWDWTVDSQAPELSPIWAPNAFGGNGDANTGCIQAPFADFTRKDIDDPTQTVCVQRQWSNASNPLMGAQVAPATIQFIMQQNDYDHFRQYLEGYPHNTVHESICGDMCDPRISPNDPIFFMHHANVDRLWSVWQQSNPAKFLKAYGGSGADANAKATDIMSMFGVAPNAPVSDMFVTNSNAANGRMCFVYDNTAPTPVKLTPPVSKSKRDVITPHPFDRTDKVNIRFMDPLSDAFLKKWRYNDQDIATIRHVEESIRQLTDKLNLDSEYTSPYRLEVLEQGVIYGWTDKTPEQQARDEKAVLDAFNRAMAQL
ncbi:hypothetical protein HDV04_005172 [Boothiomyces sp. JEL0838]|nr:hypothetical protein HDV04_005172 [Boothiomyces sp. JEL0838]